jgi:hypothetical protein
MMGLWIALVWLIWGSVSPALAEVYRWTDNAGKIHLTDNPDTIPPAYRAGRVPPGLTHQPLTRHGRLTRSHLHHNHSQ